MEDIVLGDDVDRRGMRAFLKSRLVGLDPDSIVRIKCAKGIPDEVRTAVTAKLLRDICPATMNIQFSAGFFGERRRSDS
jgi:hypothetical protein